MSLAFYVELAKAILLLKTHAEQSFSSQPFNLVTLTTILGILREVVSSPHSFSWVTLMTLLLTDMK
jgi:hypothetical protein